MDRRRFVCVVPAAFPLLIQVACTSVPVRSVVSPTVTSAPFGATADGRTAELFTLTNGHGIQIKLTNYGGIITSLRTPDRSGQLDDIVLGYDSLAGYLRNSPYFGAIVGRYGNRIARGIFTSVTDLSRKLMRYIRAYSKNARPFKWKYSDVRRRILPC